MFSVITPTTRTILCSLLTSALLCLTACSDGGSSGGGIPPVPDPDPVTGTFVPGPVEGLHYETATQSGLTSESGEFQYLEGETVTFSIGGIEFGSALGATEINLPQLLDTTLPTTEAGLRAELETYDDVTDFDRVANAAMLLMALDADGDVSNGLDLSGWHEQLENESVSFDLNIYYFSVPNYYPSLNFRLESINNNGLLRLRNTAQIPGDIPAYAPLHYLYEALGISVPVQVEAMEERDDGNDAVIDYRRTTTYSDRMAISYAYDDDADNIVDNEYSDDWDSYGRRLGWTASNDGDDDGIIDDIETTEHSWSDLGNPVVESSEDDSNADGVAEQIETVTYTYNGGINPAEILEESDSDADGSPESTEIIKLTYDEEGRILTIVEDDDGDADGTPEERDTTTYTYDAEGNVTSDIREADSNFDGLVDTIFQRTYTYDEAGNELTDLSERIDDPQGAPDTVNYLHSNTYTYDGAGNRLTRVYERDITADDDIDYRSTHTFTYDADGNWLTQNVEYDTDGNDAIDYEYHHEQEYDADGNRTSHREEFLHPIQPDTIRLRTYTYDDQGNETQRVVEEDNTGGADGGHDGGNFDSRTTYTYAYNETRHLISETEEEDTNADDIIEQTDVETYSYQTLDQGVMYMVYYYWD